MAEVKSLIVNGVSRFNNTTYSGLAYADAFVTNGGTHTQFVKGDGTLDSTTYVDGGYGFINGVKIGNIAVAYQLGTVDKGSASLPIYLDDGVPKTITSLNVSSGAITGGTITGSSLVSNGNLTVKGNTTLGDATTDTTTISGSASVGTALNVSGNTTLGTNSSNTTTINGALVANNNATVNGNLIANGNVTLGNEATDAITINGTTTVDNTLEVNGATDLNSTLDVSGNTSITGELGVLGNATFENNAHVKGNLTVDGHTTLGNSDGDRLYIKGLTYLYDIGGYDGTNESTSKSLQEVIKGKYLRKEYLNSTNNNIPALTSAQANDGWLGSFYFINAIPTSSVWSDPWWVKYRIWVNGDPNDTNGNVTAGVYDCYFCVTGTTVTCKMFNNITNTSCYPIYWHNIITYDSQAKYDNRASHPAQIGVRITSSYRTTTMYRDVIVEVLDYGGCEVTLRDTPAIYASLDAYSTYYNYRTYINATSRGLQETGDNDNTYYNYLYYTRFIAGANGISQYSLIMETGDGTWQSFTKLDTTVSSTYGAGTAKTKNTVGFRLGSKIYYVNTSANYKPNTTNTTLGNSIVMNQVIAFDLRYSTNCGTTLVALKPVYIVGTIGSTDGLFYLDDIWWTQTTPTTEDGKIYIKISDSAHNTYQCDLVSDNVPMWFKNGLFRPYDTYGEGYHIKKSGDTMTGMLTLYGDPVANKDAATKQYVDTQIGNLPSPMVFKGTLGTGGTITALPTVAASNTGWTYKVITAGTYASQSAKSGDVFVSNGSTWILIPSGDDIEDTWRNIKVNGTEVLGSGISSGALNLKGSTYITVSGAANSSDVTFSSKNVVTNIGVSNDKLTWAKDGTAQTALTIPYATTALNLTNKPVLATSGTTQITVKAGEKTSDPFTVPYATLSQAQNVTAFTSGQDLNDFKTAGAYGSTGTSINLSLLNKPTGCYYAETRLDVINIANATTNYIFQRYWTRSQTNFAVYERTYSNSAWGDWMKTINSGNYTEYTVKKDGTGATGVWPISVTGNAATATLATTADNLSTNPELITGTTNAATHETGIKVKAGNKTSDPQYIVPFAEESHKMVPLKTKLYDDTSFIGTGENWPSTTRYFMSVKPNSASDYWHVKYKIRIWIPNDTSKRSTTSIVEYFGYGISMKAYKVWNTVGPTYATYYHTVYWLNATGLANGYGHAIGESILYAANYTTASWYRHVQVDLLEYSGCDVTLFDSLLKWENCEGYGLANDDPNNPNKQTNYAQNLNAQWTVNSTSQGLQESGDSDNITSTQLYYTRIKAGTNGIMHHSLVMEDSNGAWQSFTTTAGTGVSKTKNTTGFRLGSKVYYMSISSNVTAGNYVGHGAVYENVAIPDFRYDLNINTTSGHANNLLPRKPLYIVGTIGTTDGLFYLDDVWWTQDEPTSDNGKVYIKICDGVYADYENDRCYRGDLISDAVPMWFKNGLFRPYPEGQPTLSTTGNQIVVNTNNMTSNALTVPYATNAGTATNLASSPELAEGTGDTNAITVTAGSLTSHEFVVPYARTAGTANSVDWSNISNIPSLSPGDHNHDERYVTLLGTNGDYVTWTKNGTANNITVPYSTVSSELRYSVDSQANPNDFKGFGSVKLGRRFLSTSTDLFNKASSSSNANGILYVPTSGTSFGTQVGFNQNAEMFLRAYNNAPLANVPWKTVLDSTTYTTYTVDKTGTGASGTNWNISVLGSAAKLTTARTIWGQSFDGSGNVNGVLKINAAENNFREGIRIKPYSGWTTILLGGTDLITDTGTSANSWSMHTNSGNFYLSKNASNSGTSAPAVAGSATRFWGHANGFTLGNINTTTYQLNVGGTIYTSTNMVATTTINAGTSITAGTTVNAGTDVIAEGDVRAKGNDIYAGSASGSQCHMQYDGSMECLKIMFD